MLTISHPSVTVSASRLTPKCPSRLRHTNSNTANKPKIGSRSVSPGSTLMVRPRTTGRRRRADSETNRAIKSVSFRRKLEGSWRSRRGVIEDDHRYTRTGIHANRFTTHLDDQSSTIYPHRVQHFGSWYQIPLFLFIFNHNYHYYLYMITMRTLSVDALCLSLIVGNLIPVPYNPGDSSRSMHERLCTAFRTLLHCRVVRKVRCIMYRKSVQPRFRDRICTSLD